MKKNRSNLPLACFLAAIATLCFFAPPASAREPEPDYKDVDPAAAEKLIDEDADLVVLDIRTPAEFAEGHIDGASNLDFLAEDFAEKLGPLARDTPYLVHCRSGGRSTRALEVFKKLGFLKIYHLKDGMNGWTEAGKPVIKTPAPPK